MPPPWEAPAGFFMPCRVLFLFAVQKRLIPIADAFHILAELHLPALVEPEDLAAQRADLAERMRDKDGCGAAAHHLLHFRLALRLERAVADGQHLVQNQNIRFHEAGNGERQPRFHAGRELLERPVRKVLQLGEVQDFLKRLVHEFARIAQHGAAQISVLLHREIAVKAARELEQRRHGAVPLHPALRRFHDAGDRLEQCGLPRPVRADDAQHIAPLERKGHVLVRPELRHMVIARDLPQHKFFQPNVLEISRDIPDGDLVKL